MQDGYAVVAADGAGEFEVVGESRAGAMDNVQVAPGRIAYITTGWAIQQPLLQASTPLSTPSII